jgi:hypothetical protein
VAGYLTLAPELSRFREQFERLARDAESIAGNLTDDQFNWKPPSGGWSVAQCIEHLNISIRSYLPALDEGIADAIRRGLYGEGPFRYGWFARTFVRSVGPGRRMKFKAPAAWAPPDSRPRQETLAAFRAYQVQCIDRLRQANGLDLSRARVKSPASSLLRLPLGAAFATLVAHAQRHLEQARRVLAEPAFPTSEPSR